MAKFIALSILTFLLFFLLNLINSVSEVQAKQFWIINYSVRTADISSVVGRNIRLPIYVTNLGVVSDSYVINITPVGSSDKRSMIIIDKTILYIPESGVLSYSETEDVNVGAMILSADETIPVGIWVYSNLDTVVCTRDADCSYLSSEYSCETSAGKCSHYKTINLKAEFHSMPELDWFGVLQIFLAATIIFIINSKRN
jgi:hypothetical protein